MKLCHGQFEPYKETEKNPHTPRRYTHTDYQCHPADSIAHNMNRTVAHVRGRRHHTILSINADIRSLQITRINHSYTTRLMRRSHQRRRLASIGIGILLAHLLLA